MTAGEATDRSLGCQRDYRQDVNRKKAYFWMMGVCLVLILLAWNVVRHFSVPLAVGMSIVAAIIPPAAAIVANWGRGG